MTKETKAGTLFSIAAFSAVAFAVFHQDTRSFFTTSFGSQIFDLPSWVVLGSITMVLFLPIIPFGMHLMKLALAKGNHGSGKAHLILSVIDIPNDRPELKVSQKVVILGALYFFTLMAAWIIFAETKGI